MDNKILGGTSQDFLKDEERDVTLEKVKQTCSGKFKKVIKHLSQCDVYFAGNDESGRAIADIARPEGCIMRVKYIQSTGCGWPTLVIEELQKPPYNNLK